MQPQIPPTPIHGPSAPAPNPRNIALDWVDALGILGGLDQSHLALGDLAECADHFRMPGMTNE